MKNKIGLKDIFVAPVTVNSDLKYTTEEPTRIPSVKTLKVEESFSDLPIYGDDSLEINKSFFNSATLELEFNYLSSENKALLFGKKFKDGGLTSNTEDENGTVALGYRSRTATGKFEIVWFYVCNVTSGDSYDVETIGEKPNASTQSLKLTAMGRQNDKNYKFEINQNDIIEGNTEAIALCAINPTSKAPVFFDEVQEPIVGA